MLDVNDLLLLQHLVCCKMVSMCVEMEKTNEGGRLILMEDLYEGLSDVCTKITNMLEERF